MSWADGLAGLAIGLCIAFLSFRILSPLYHVLWAQSADPSFLGAIGEVPDDVATLEAGLKQCVRGLGARTGIIALQEEQQLVPVAYYGFPETEVEQIQPVRPNLRLQEQVLLRGEPLILSGPRDMRSLGDHPAWNGMLACLCVPLQVLGVRTGILAVSYRRRRAFSHAEVGLLKSVAQQIGMVLTSSRLRERNQQAMEELTILQRIDQQLAASLDVDVVCRTVVRGARRLISADASFLGLWTAAGELALVQTSGCDPSWSDTAVGSGIRWQPGEGLVVQSSDTQIVADVSARPPVRDPAGFIHIEGLEAWMGAPFEALCPVPAVPAPPHLGVTMPAIRLEGIGEWGEVKGILYVANRKPTSFTSYQAQLLGNLAARTAISIANACLFRTVERSKQEWEATIDAIEDVCLAVDPDYTIRRCNRAAAEAQGLKPQQVVGRKCYEVFHHQDVPIEDCPVARSLCTGERASVESFDPQKGRMHQMWAYPLFDDHGQVWTVVEYSRDVTASKQAQARLLQEERFSALRQTISGIAHELNNPLAVVIGYAQLLRDSQDRDEIQGGLDSIYRQAHRAREVVKNLLTFAPLQPTEKGERAVPYQRVSVNQLLEHVLALRDYALGQIAAEVVTDLATDLPWISADSSQLQQAFLDIIASAEQALVQVGEPRRLVVESRLREEGDILISVTDSGPSIPPSEFSRLFVPFLTEDTVQKTGSRLSLGASSGTVQEHGGQIWAQNGPGRGVSVFVTLPVPSEHQEGSSTVEPAHSDEEDIPSLHDGPPPRILVIDDECSIVTLLQRTLEPVGYQVDGMPEGNAALSLLQERDYALVIIDAEMSGPDGCQIHDLINERFPALRQRAIFSTGDTANAGTRRFLQERGVPYLVKPFDLEEVQRVVEGRIRELRLTQQRA